MSLGNRSRLKGKLLSGFCLVLHGLRFPAEREIPGWTGYCDNASLHFHR